MGTIQIKIGKMPGKIYDVALSAGSTVAAAAALVPELGNVANYGVRINGANATTSSTVTDGALVLFVEQIKGN